jgi:2-C-methyl-D-erythritol 4-phosphate cytidylyltransferase/2-C-methyl-D-erythritol 2,4-cyclodiphosphate synthase
VQTPQAFRLAALLEAHEAAARDGRSDFTDDAGLIRWRGGTVATFPGDAAAFKITTPDDLVRAEAQVAARLSDIRSATGYDVHAFGPGAAIMLGGVRIAHDCGVVGHSDADVLLHALTDALLGCLADGDIGSHFPPSDMRWKGAPSRLFLEEAVRRVRARGGAIRHLDGTVVCEAPRIGPHRDAIRQTIAEIAGIESTRVSLKATTSEKLGFTGRREGIAALATATVALPQ